MDLTFRLSGPWGPGKGANLQPTEVDNNFWAIAEAILDLQSNPAQPVGITSISVSGTQMTITLTDGSVMGPFTLPVLAFRWRGEWVPGAAYAELDVFSVVDVGIFMALLDHISGSTFDPDITAGAPPAAALQQLFGSADASLSALPDVEIIEPLNDQDFLYWDAATEKWTNVALGSMAYQDDNAVVILGGSITGMPPPTNPDDVATKGYVDSLPAGATAPDATIMANLAGIVAPAIPNTLSDILDYVLATSVRGTLLYRGAAGWSALLPSATAFQFLMTLGPGADPEWHAGTTSGITQLYPGTGIDMGGVSIVSTGTISLAAIATHTILANTSGGSAAPTATTLTLLLDSVLGNTRGAILTRAGSGWVALAPGTSGYYLQTQGSTADAVWSSPSGSGTVTSISAGTGISTGGAPITGAGTVSLAAIGTASVLANISGATAAPVPATVSVLFDSVFGSTQGAVLYRNATTWVMLPPGTSGQVLTTSGASANPAWANAAAGAPIANLLVLANISGATAAPSGNSLSNIFDMILGSSRGLLVYRGSAGWVALSPGASGEVLTTGGTAGDPHWAAAAAGSSISVGDTAPASPSTGDGWWDSAGGQLYIRYNDGTSSQWVPASNQPGPPGTPGTVIPLPVAIVSGGTGQTTAAAALSALGGAPLASPVFTGDPQAPTPATSDSDTSIATTAFVKAQGYAPLASPVFTGDARAVTPATADNDTSVATTAYVQAQGYATSASVSTADNLRVLRAGDTMSGPLTATALTTNGNVSAGNFQIGGSVASQAGTFGFLNANGPSIICNGTAAPAAGTMQFSTGGTLALTIGGSQVSTFSGPVRLTPASAITPDTDNQCYCGSPTLAFFQNNSHNYATISDPAKKTDIASVPDGMLAQVMAIEPFSYLWKTEDPDNPKHWGFMAPDVAAAMGPDFAGVMRDKESGVFTLSYNDLTAVLWKAVQELAAKVAALEGKPA